MRYFKNIESETVTNQTKKIMNEINHIENLIQNKIEAIIAYILRNNKIPTQKYIIDLAEILNNKNEGNLIQALNAFENKLIQY